MQRREDYPIWSERSQSKGDVMNTGDIIKIEEQFKARFQSQFGQLKILNI
jgi:hypothetical protein